LLLIPALNLKATLAQTTQNQPSSPLIIIKKFPVIIVMGNTNSIKSYLNVDFLQKYLCGEFGFRKLKIAPMGYYKSQSLWAVLRCLMCSSGKLFVQVSPEIIMPIDEIMMEFEGDELTILQASL
jgi:hypothetical protein